MKKLSTIQGISIGIGSIMGSGILFLPSMTTLIGGQNTLMAWLFIMFLCLPGLYFFSEMVSSVQDESGIAGFVSLGLGRHMGNTIPILLLGTVSLGMPSAAIVATKYVQSYFYEYQSIQVFLPFLLVYLGIFTTIRGLGAGSFLNSFVAIFLFAVGVGILVICTSHLPEKPPVLPQTGIKGFMKASVLAFWAFAGFENLTFLAKEFKNPKRDLVISAFISVLSCGALYYLLTMFYGQIIPYSKIDSAIGLSQLSKYSSESTVLVLLIALFAIFAVVINLVSWSAGVSRAIVSSANENMLPKYFSKLNSQNNPQNAALFLAGLFTISLLFNAFFPEYFDKLLTVVSTNLLMLYLLGLIAFFNFTKKITVKYLTLIFIIGISVVLLSSGWLLIYPVSLILISFYMSKKNNKEVMNGK